MSMRNNIVDYWQELFVYFNHRMTNKFSEDMLTRLTRVNTLWKVHHLTKLTMKQQGIAI